MRKKHLLPATAFLIIFILLLISLKPSFQNTDSKTNNQKVKLQQSVEVEENGKAIKAVWYVINDLSKVTLIPNFIQKYTASEISKKFNCQSLFNAGFYTPQNTPIGFFVAESQILNQSLASNLFNGYLGISQENELEISYSPNQASKIAIQSGPVVFKDGKAVTLKLTEDKEARRMVAIQTLSNDLVFAAFYNSKSAFLGPTLQSLPQLLSQFQNKTNIKIKNAINLDGGSASSFKTPVFVLSEISPVGSFFCESF